MQDLGKLGLGWIERLGAKARLQLTEKSDRACDCHMRQLGRYRLEPRIPFHMPFMSASATYDSCFM